MGANDPHFRRDMKYFEVQLKQNTVFNCNMTWMKAKVCLNATFNRVGQVVMFMCNFTIDLGMGRVY